MAKQKTVHETDLKRADEGRVYEVSYLINPHRAEDEVARTVATIREHIQNKEGQVQHEEPPQLIELAYRVEITVESKKQRYDNAYFGWMVFTTTPPQVVELKRELKHLPDLLRFLVVKRDGPEEVPSASAEAGEGGATPVDAAVGSSDEAPASDDSRTSASDHTIDEAIEELVT